MIIRRKTFPWKLWQPVLQHFFCDSAGEPIDISWFFLRNNSLVMWVWIIVMLGYQIYHLSLSAIMTLILISLEQAWYNCNHKGSIPIHKSLLWWTLRGTFPLDMCRVFLDQLQLQIPNVFSLLFPRGSLPHPPYLVLFLCSDFFIHVS